MKEYRNYLYGLTNYEKAKKKFSNSFLNGSTTKMDHVDYGLLLLGQKIHYLWGGNCPEEGMDCSGYVNECLRGVGFLDKRDLASYQLYNFAMENDWVRKKKPERGALLFFGEGDLIKHVSIALDKHLHIESGGGGKYVYSKQRAIKSDAFVRIRPINSRSDLLHIIKPYRSGNV